MRNIVIMPIEPMEGDYNTVPQYHLYEATDFSGDGLNEGSIRIAAIFRNGGSWEFLLGTKEPTFADPDAEVEVISDDELSEVKRVARQLLDPSAVFFLPQLALDPI